jgi:hypothetical protein
MKSKLLTNITPGEILEEDFLKPMAITQYRLAKDIGVTPRLSSPNGRSRRGRDPVFGLHQFYRLAQQCSIEFRVEVETSTLEDLYHFDVSSGAISP